MCGTGQIGDRAMERDHAPEVDADLVGCASFAQPILAHIRKVVHAAQRGIEEAIK